MNKDIEQIEKWHRIQDLKEEYIEDMKDKSIIEKGFNRLNNTQFARLCALFLLSSQFTIAWIIIGEFLLLHIAAIANTSFIFDLVRTIYGLGNMPDHIWYDKWGEEEMREK